MRRLDGALLAAAVATAGGLVVLLVGTVRAVPFVFFGTAEERASIDDGRLLVLAGAVILLVAAALVGARAGTARALLVAAPGLAVAALVYAFPDAAYAWLALLLLGPAALVAALTAPVARG